MTFDDFLNYGEEGRHYEWVAGAVCQMPPRTVEHQLLLGFLGSIAFGFVQAKSLGTVLPRFTMYLPERPSGRAPDLMFVSASQSYRIKHNYLEGGADLIVEIVSPDTAHRDRNAKFKEYEQARVGEYWIIDPIRHRDSFYRLDAQGCYKAVQPDVGGVYYSSAITGLWIKTDWLWENNPSELAIYKEWGLI